MSRWKNRLPDLPLRDTSRSSPGALEESVREKWIRSRRDSKPPEGMSRVSRPWPPSRSAYGPDFTKCTSPFTSLLEVCDQQTFAAHRGIHVIIAHAERVPAVLCPEFKIAG